MSDLTTTHPTVAARLGEPRRLIATRTAGRDVRFRGWEIAEGRHGSGGSSGYDCDWNRGVVVTLYLSVAGQWVIHRDYWSQWQGESGRQEAEICCDPTSLLRALEQEGELRPAEKAAWENACDAVPELLADHSCEDIA